MSEVKKLGNTAIKRKVPSLPMRWLCKNGKLELAKEGRKLDYGSGRGFDAEFYNFEKYDPWHHPTLPEGPFYIITCNYVLNVLPPDEVGSVIDKIKSLLEPTGIAYISVRRDKAFLNNQHYVELNEKLITENSQFAIYEMRK